MSIDFSLTPEELRVIGCLMEKSVTTPDQYPLTLNALINACNQKSSREPVMHLDHGMVERITRQLDEKALISSSPGKSNVMKYTQRMCNTLLSELQFNEAEYAVVTLMMLRGPQTPGELRSHSGRLYSFADNVEVKMVLKGLMDREDGPVIARLPRQPGRKDHEYTHLLSGQIDSVSEEAPLAQRSATVSQKQDRLAELEARVSDLERALVDLAERLGEAIRLGSGEGEDTNAR